jgi:endonuclease YncB( thermonuclease family)
MVAMELASRIVSIMLGVAVAVLLLWPIPVPVGFGEAWWASRQAQSRAEAPPAPRPQPDWARSASLSAPKAEPAAPAPTPAPHAVTPTGNAAKPAEAPGKPSEQVAALNDKDKTGALAPNDTKDTTATKVYFRVTVRDGGTLQAGKVVIRLSGIAPREAAATCKDTHGKSWPCGAAAKAALTRLIRSRAVTCTLPKGREHDIFDASCTVGDTDLSTWLVRQGWATPKGNETALAKAAEAAKSEKLGLWRGAE